MRTPVLLLSLLVTPLLSADWQFGTMYPDSGTIGGGDVVTITTTYEGFDCNPFVCGMFPEVRFGDVEARSAVNPEGTIRIITPAHAKGTVPVTISFEGIPKMVGSYTFVDTQSFLPLWNYDEVLVPVAVGGTPAPGANGSLWVSELWVSNRGQHRVELMHGLPSLCTAGCGAFPAIEAGETRKIEFPANAVNAAYRLYVQTGGKDDVSFSLRIRDVSHADEHQGTEIPVALLSEFKPRLTILNVPMDSLARTSLRIYSSSSYLEFMEAQVDVFSVDGREKVASAVIQLRSPAFGTADRDDYFSYAFVADLRTQFPTLAEGKYRLEIKAPDSADGIAALHGLVSVTNNRTQLVTAIPAR